MKDREQSIADLTARYGQLDQEMAALEEKRYANLNRPQMEARLVDLSQQYDEAAKASGGQSEIDAQILALETKLARRRAEQYQSKYTQAIAEASAKVQELGGRYRQEAYFLKTFVPGVSCPTCHRAVTQENLTEVQKCQRRFKIVGKRRRNFVVFRRGW